MKGKKFLALAVSAAMCMSLLAGCGGTGTEDVVENSVQEETAESSSETEPETEAESQPEEESGAEVSENPLEKLTQGYYSYVYNTEPDGSGMEMYNFFHFYEEQPVLGSVFYAGFAMNQIFFVGTYAVEEVPYDYNCYPDREAVLAATDSSDTRVAGTAPYTITCYDWDGNEIGKMGFDGDNIYNDSEAISAVSTKENVFLFDADGSETGYADYYAGEVGQAYMDFVGDEDATSTLTLYHNGTYMDLVGMMVEGTWSMEESAEGYSFVLTPDNASDTGATLAVAGDKATAVYTSDDGTVMNMSNAAAGPAVAYSFAGTFEIAGMNADLVAYCYQDGTAAVIASMSGMEVPVDQGTWEMTETYSMLLHLDGAGDIESVADETGVSLPYANEGAAETVGTAIDTTLNFVAE